MNSWNRMGIILAAYYVDMLRANGGRSKFCESTR